LNTSTIVLLGASSSGSETLKNLVLPCVKRFIIVDDAKITARDVGSNFFLTEDDIGKNRAVVMKENLHELNPTDTEGVAVEKSVAEFIDSTDCKWGDEFSLIIGTDMDNATV
jgi:molybdopterin/thiamine biosynthesis adenylyltransferase